ncbi:DUF3047 domain-containing protein [Wenzhouxiangella sp. XN79A]|uniref:DUF3047 domain-containing protein n=1 Tax=Wenzhouxiangella sp. XN79A TaxID=2724193 RepID=UPI00144A57D6|nr:DUF3047 domain-containing protein [Wenzhouxiangella sp. XN79A]NKI35215.1 DUF3047 domain-containing protein [Wenzhouxiangella sp. XN79A]
MRIAVKLLILVLACATPLGPAAVSMAFDPAEIADWDERRFEGETSYEIVSPDAAGAEHAALRADCRDGTASGRLLEREFDLAAAPILEWRWRVEALYDGLDERSKAGDDYPARVYVVARRWPAFRSRAINYVWSGHQPVGSTWPNAFSEAFVMVAVRSGHERLGEWVTERRDVRADFLRLHDLDLDTVDALAIMTDCDNAGQSTTAFYGPIRWRSVEAE